MINSPHILSFPWRLEVGLGEREREKKRDHDRGVNRMREGDEEGERE